MRFRMVLSKAIVDSRSAFPKELLVKIKSKLDSLVNAKKAVEYSINTNCAVEIWKFFQNNNLPMAASVEFDVAQGVPPLNGISLKSSNDPKFLCKLTIGRDADVENWEAEWLITYINRKMEKAKLSGRVHEAQVKACLGRAKAGEDISGVGLIRESEKGKVPEDAKPISLSISKARKELYIVINQKEALSGLSIDEVMATVNQGAQSLQNAISSPVTIEENIAAKVEEAMNGPGKYGLGLPITILAGFGSGTATATATAAQEKQKVGSESLLASPEDEEIKQIKKAPDHLFVKISEDRMEAHIINFSEEIYKSKKYRCSKAWLVEEFERFDLAEEAYEPHIDALLKAMQVEDSLNNMTVATGTVGIPAEQPYLFESYKHAKQEAAANSDEKIDFRDLHQTDIVKEGMLVAEVKYMIPEEPGKNVHGKDVPGPKPEPFKVTVGDGIEEKKGGKYWSKDYGVPSIKGNKISLLKVLVHIGDVNMKSGNIIFDGPVEIRGDIDLGATVEATGDIKIIGNIEAAFVSSLKGSIIVQGGIITTNRGKVEAKKDVRATFVENSQIIAGEKLIVQKALLNSTVHVGDTVEVMQSGGGMIAGGRINAGKKITTPNLGFQKGHMTIVNCGGDWKTEYAISINENRLHYLDEYLVRNRAELREITGKRKTDIESLEHKKLVQERIKRLRPILDKLQSRVNALKAGLTYYSHAEIFVWDMLYPNCQILISRHPVKSVHEYKEVVITPKKRKGEFVQGIPDYMEFKESQKARLKTSA